VNENFTAKVRAQVEARSKGVCEIPGCRRRAVHMHHRKLRRFKDHSAVNALHTCWPHHEWIHANIDKAVSVGWLVRSWDDPASVPVQGYVERERPGVL
jgi:hypothetical protein